MGYTSKDQHKAAFIGNITVKAGKRRQYNGKYRYCASHIYDRPEAFR